MESQEQPYQHSLAQSRAGDGGVSVRSRSSSIVSTRTGVTISTLQDDTRSVRSMELVVGGRIFSISRDGSRITEHPALPPYNTFAPPDYSSLERVAEGTTPAELPAPNIPNYQEVVSPPEEPRYDASLQANTPVDPIRQSPEGRRDTLSLLNGDISLAELPSTPADIGRGEPGSVVRTHSFVPGPEKITVVAKRRSVSESNIQAHLHPDSNNNNNNWSNPLRRRNGIRLPQLDTGISSEQPRNTFSRSAGPSPSPRMTHSAGPSLGGNLPWNVYTGVTTGDGSILPRGRSPPTTPRATRSPLLAVPQGPAVVEEGYADTEMPPAMDTENEISIHFSRMIRSIDREHRRVLHQKCRELADLRERLNEVDQVYRKELKSRDFIIDELRQQLNLMEFRMEEKVERARNQVEDIWEKRWKEQEELLLNMQRRQSQADLSRMIGRRRPVGKALSPSQGMTMLEDEEIDDGHIH